MKSIKLLVVIASLQFAGATTLYAADCRGTDWYRLGERDGETNSNLISKYTAQCAAVGVTPDAARYAEGRKRGLYVRVVDHWLYTP